MRLCIASVSQQLWQLVTRARIQLVLSGKDLVFYSRKRLTLVSAKAGRATIYVFIHTENDRFFLQEAKDICTATLSLMLSR